MNSLCTPNASIGAQLCDYLVLILMASCQDVSQSLDAKRSLPIYGNEALSNRCVEAKQASYQKGLFRDADIDQGSRDLYRNDGPFSGSASERGCFGDVLLVIICSCVPWLYIRHRHKLDFPNSVCPKITETKPTLC